jgi:hypothetical protein
MQLPEKKGLVSGPEIVSRTAVIVLVPLRFKRPSGGARSNVARRNPVMFDARAVARRFSQKLLSVRQAFPYTETD